MERKFRHLKPPSSEITTQSDYLSRREWLKMIGLVTAAGLLTACVPKGNDLSPTIGPASSGDVPLDDLGNPANTLKEITNYNNYYEFSTDKQAVAKLAENFQSTPWAVEVGGLVNKPKTFSLEQLLHFEQVERVYRLRCVEAWSMVIPWTGFELNKLLKVVEPLGSAKYVKFTALLDPK
ncbi:MAG: molybdopterin-dependent oxidoreductase, partial [Anaerolineales bacterium]